MEKILDKLGIYDFWATIIPGFFFTFSFFQVCTALFREMKFSYEIVSFIDYILLFVVVYIIGMILQEIGSFLKKRNCGFADVLVDPYSSLTEEEKALVSQAFDKKFPPVSNQKTQFNLINTLLQEKSLANRPSKLNIISIISRSFAITCFLMLLMSFLSILIKIINGMYIDICMHMTIFFIYTIMSAFLVKRANHFQRMWVKQIIRVFIVTILSTDEH